MAAAACLEILTFSVISSFVVVLIWGVIGQEISLLSVRYYFQGPSSVGSRTTRSFQNLDPCFSGENLIE